MSGGRAGEAEQAVGTSHAGSPGSRRGPGRPIRVLMIVENLTVPVDQRVWKEATTLRDAGYEVEVICPAGAGYPSGTEELSGVVIHRHPAPPEGRSKLAFVREYAWALRWELRLARRVHRRRGFDIVHICNPPDLLFLVAGWFRLFGGVKVVFDHHDLTPELFQTKFGRHRVLHRILLLAERLTFRLADRVISTNESFREIARTRGRVPADRVAVVMNGPDPERFRPGRPDPEIRAGREHLVGYVGHIGTQYGIDGLVEAARRIVRDRGRPDVHFMIIGDGPLLPEIRRRVDELGLSANVELVGAVYGEELPRRLASCDIGVVPVPVSPAGDLSTATKTLEYMAMGLPVVEYDRLEARRSAGEAAVYAAPGEIEEFAERILELVDDPGRRAEMGRIGRERVVRRFAWPLQAEVLRAVYDSLAAEVRR